MSLYSQRSSFSMFTFKLLILLIFLVDLLNHANVEAIQTRATISPREYIASLDPSTSTTFQCEVTGADSILWIVDGQFALRQEIRQRGISTSHQVTVNETEGRFTSNISISRSNINRNASILCMACVIQGTDILSAPAFFKVQGLLGPPPNLSLSMQNEPQDAFVKVLTWDEPNTLNITDVEPDISHYQICYNLVVSTLLICTNTTGRKFTFLNVGVDILFTVIPVNIVGEGNSSAIMHWACDHSNEETISVPGNEIVALPTLYRNTNLAVIVNFTFSQTALGGGDSNCFDIYEVWTTSKSDLMPINHGIQIPRITVDHASDARWITLSVDSGTGLRENELYYATINAINEHGRTQNTDNINFSTYDVQSVSVLPSNESDALEFTCTYIRGSQAQGCRLSVCQDQGYGTLQQPQCRNITITRNQNHRLSSKTVNGFNSGLYTIISEISEIERDGSETVHGFVPEFDTNEYTDSPMIVTIHASAITNSRIPVMNDGTLWPKFLIITVGSITAIVIILIISLLMIVILILWYRQRFKATVEPEEVVYDEPYPLPLRPKTELQMEACPAYGIVLSSGTHPQ